MSSERLSEELLPCPFCGAKKAGGGSEHWTDESGVGHAEYGVSCGECWASTDVYPRQEEAIEAWNRRASAQENK